MRGVRRRQLLNLAWPLVHACAVLATLSGSPALAADSPAAPQVEANASPAIRMTWSDLRDAKLPDVAAFTRLWNDKLASAQAKWRSPGQLGATSGKPLPAFTLSHTFASANPPVLVSILFDLYDCELPGNGPGADLFARCPMRVVTGGPGATRVKNIEGVCHLYVPPTARPGDGPDPAKNFTSVALDASRRLHLQIVQFGRPVPACNADYALE
jgi:hypothetical protein